MVSKNRQKRERFLNQNLVSFIIKQLLKSTPTPKKMHILQPKHTKLNEKQVEELLNKLNISKTQLPKVLSSDVALPEGCEVGDVIEIKRKGEDRENTYYRAVV